MKLNPAVELPQKSTRVTKPKEEVAKLFLEGDICWMNGFFAEQSCFHSIPPACDLSELRLLCLFVADPIAFLE